LAHVVANHAGYHVVEMNARYVGSSKLQNAFGKVNNALYGLN